MLSRRDWSCLLLGAVFATAYQAWSGPELQLELGQCRFGKAPDGTFYQSDHYTSNYLTPRCASLGLADKFEKGGRLGWRIAGIVTGTIEARDNVFVRNDDGIRGAPCTPQIATGCHATMNGSGWMRGVSFSGTGDLPLGPLTAIGEFGLLFFKSQFKARATEIENGGAPMEVNAESKWWDMPTPMLGLSLRYRDLYVAARHYWPGEHRPLSLTDHSFTQLSVGLVFKLP